MVLLQVPGQSGGSAIINYSKNLVFPGSGGSTLLGYGGVGVGAFSNANGFYGNGYGIGGSGAVNALATGNPYAGGSGTVGIVIITEYIP
jgi:hypothetical protein